MFLVTSGFLLDRWPPVGSRLLQTVHSFVLPQGVLLSHPMLLAEVPFVDGI